MLPEEKVVDVLPGNMRCSRIPFRSLYLKPPFSIERAEAAASSKHLQPNRRLLTSSPFLWKLQRCAVVEARVLLAEYDPGNKRQ